jgi:hypothetical protein
MFCDTDSIAIVATETGDTIPCAGVPHSHYGQPAVKALSWDQVDRIRARFDQLHPYDRSRVPGSILELEKQNYQDNNPAAEREQLYCYSISAKRYALYNRNPSGEVNLRKPSQHGLGHLLNPTNPTSTDRDWISQVWVHIIRTETGSPTEMPAWIDSPAVGQLSVSTPVLHKPFDKRNKTKDGNKRPYWEQVKPFNFMLTAHTDTKWKRPTDTEDPDRFHLIAPWNPDPINWLTLDWIDRYSPTGKTYGVTTSGNTGTSGHAVVSTYGSTVDRYRTQPEAKSLDPQTLKPSLGRSHGVLQRRPVTTTAHGIKYIGKESNQLEEVEAGIHHDPTEVLSQYSDPKHDDWTDIIRPGLILAIQNGLTTDTEIARHVDVNRSSVGRWRRGETKPRRSQMDRLIEHIAKLAAADSERLPPRTHLASVELWLDLNS